jgi:hypothetical protein
VKFNLSRYILAHRAFTLAGAVAYTYPCSDVSPATVRGALTLSGLAGVELTGRGLHSSTFQLNPSRF